jgi:hypothetical protein
MNRTRRTPLVPAAAPLVAAWLASLPLLLCAGCFGSSDGDKSDSGSGSKPLVTGVARPGTVTPFTPPGSDSATADYAPGADAVVELWKSRVTMPDGTLTDPAQLKLTLIPGGLMATESLVPVSPLVQFDLTDAAGSAVRRGKLRVNLTVDALVDREVADVDTVVIIIVGYGTDAEVRYLLTPEYLASSLQDDGGRVVGFQTRDTSFAYAVAASPKGALQPGYVAYPAVPNDSADLLASTKDLTDEPASVALAWTPAEGSRSGYRLAYAYDGDPEPSEFCTGATKLDPAAVKSERKNFPAKFAQDSTVLSGLADGRVVTIRLCSVNDREPPDVSAGIVATYDLPDRAKAVLAGAPGAATNAAALSVTVGGADVAKYKYALVASATRCSAAAYSASWIDVATPITDALTSGTWRLCVLGKISDANVQKTPTEQAFTVDLVLPGPFTLGAVTTPTNDTTPTLSWSASTDATTYQVDLSADASCTASAHKLTGITATSTTLPAVTDGTYYVCAFAVDAAGNARPATGNGALLVIDATPPAFTSLALANAAADGYVNIADHLLTTAVAGSLVASGYTTAAYAIAAEATACTAPAVSYAAAIPQADSIGLSLDGRYKVCARLADAAGNKTYGSSPALVLDLVAPALVDLPLANDAADGILTLAENSGIALLAGPLDATGQDAAGYALTDAGTTCDNSLPYGGMPRSNNAGFVADGDYKICVMLTDLAANPIAYGSSATFTLDRTPPTFNSIDLVNDALDGYINADERNSSAPLVGNLDAVDADSVGYKLVVATAPCNGGGTYTPTEPTSDDPGMTLETTYKVCVKLLDTNGNARYAASPTFRRDTEPPYFDSLPLGADAFDGYVNAAEKALAAPLVDTVVGDGYDSAVYALTDAGTPCTSALTYGAIPDASALTGSDGAYHVCAQLDDDAGNPTAYGASADFTLDTTAPTIAAVTSTSTNPSYGPGDAVAVVLTFSDPLTVTGSGTLSAHLNTTPARDAVDAPSPGTVASLSLTYNVQAGDAASALDIMSVGGHHVDTSGTLALSDAAGNPLNRDATGVSLTDDRTIVIDSTPPDPFDFTAPDAGVVNDDTPTVTWSDPGGVAAFTLAIAATAGCPSPVQTYDGPLTTYTATTLGEGDWHLCLSARDAAGNATDATSNDRVITVHTGSWAGSTTAMSAARRGATGVWDDDDDLVIVWGGFDGTTEVATGGQYDAATDAWTDTNALPTEAPEGRVQHTATWIDHKMVVWGGYNTTSHELGTGGIYTPGDPGSWTEVNVGDAPAARKDHTAIAVGATTVFIWGGDDGSGPLRAGSTYDLSDDSWTALAAPDANEPAARSGHTAIWDPVRSRVIVWGGKGAGGTALADGAEYDPSASDGNRWAPLSTAGDPPPTARYAHTAVWVGNRMLVFGGRDASSVFDDGAYYDPATGWHALPAMSPTQKRYDHRAVATDDGRLIIWGGLDDHDTPLASGSVYDTATSAWTIPALRTDGAPTPRTASVAVWDDVRHLLVVATGEETGPLTTGTAGRYIPPAP